MTPAKQPFMRRVRQIVALLRRHGAMTVQQVANRMDISPSAVRQYLKEMVRVGIVGSRLESYGERDARRMRERAHPRTPRHVLYWPIDGEDV